MNTATNIDPASGILCGDAIQTSERRLADLASDFADELAYVGLDPAAVVYRVHFEMNATNKSFNARFRQVCLNARWFLSLKDPR